jgi:hypothetical protein
MKLVGLAIAAAVGAVLALPAPKALADVDTDFADQLHGYGIYGPRDYNAWLGKIACDRLGRGLDADAFKSATFVFHNLPTGTTQEQSWQFLASAIDFYCPDERTALEQAAAHHG